MLTIKTKEYTENSLIGRFFEWTYKLSHGFSADPKHDALNTQVKDMYSKTYLLSPYIEFPEPDLYDTRTVNKLSDKKLFELDATRLKDYQTTTKKSLRTAFAIRYQKDSYQVENMLVYNENHFSPVLLNHQDGDYAPGWYIYSPKLEKWLSVNSVFTENRDDIESGRKLEYHFYQLVADAELETEYKKLYKKLQRMNTVKHVFYRVFHTIDSVILCIRFPFLYPRNRFTGLHYNNWTLIEYTKKLRERNSSYMCIRVMDDPSKEFHYHTPMHPVINTAVEELEGNGHHTITTYSTTRPDGTEYVICRDEKFKVLPRKMQFNVVWCHVNQMHTYHPDFGWIDIPQYDESKKKKSDMLLHAKDADYSNYYYTYVKSPLVKYWENFLTWFHEYVLGFIFCIPTSNELDAMDNGWLKAFGIQMCKDIRKALCNTPAGWRYLFDYRISQIKEKFGGLRWYDNGSTKEVQDIISKYESISEHTCISCGRPAKYITSGWICPYCENCISEKDKIGATVLDENGYVIGRIDKDGNFVEKKRADQQDAENTASGSAS